MDLGAYRTSWNESFSYSSAELDAALPRERASYERTTAILCAHSTAHGHWPYQACSDLRDNAPHGVGRSGSGTLGSRRGTNHHSARSKLGNLAAYAGTLLHELGHATSGTVDQSMEFEEVLSVMLGRVAATALAS